VAGSLRFVPLINLRLEARVTKCRAIRSCRYEIVRAWRDRKNG
jgi:hypothetical protein